MKRVVVTGRGLISPLGVGVQASWAALTAGRVATCHASATALPSQVLAPVQDFDVEAHVPKGIRNSTARFVHFAVCAAAEALADAGWSTPPEHLAHRSGVCFGSGVGSVATFHDTALEMADRGYRRVSPYFVPRVLVNMAAGQVSILHNLQGPNHSVSTACATGAHSIGDAYNLLRLGQADVMVAGSSDSALDDLSIAGFCRMKALSTRFNDAPAQASRPFDAQADGFVMGEGAGALVLEELEHALARGATIYGELVGYGLSGDAYHITSPDPEGRGQLRCIQGALQGRESVDYVNAHATSTPVGDAVEAKSIAAALGGESRITAAVTSTKGATGHLLGGAGSVEAVFALLAMQHNLVPPTANLHESIAPGIAQAFPIATPREINSVLTNSFGFGGTNASLLFQRFIQ